MENANSRFALTSFRCEVLGRLAGRAIQAAFGNTAVDLTKKSEKEKDGNNTIRTWIQENRKKRKKVQKF